MSRHLITLHGAADRARVMKPCELCGKHFEQQSNCGPNAWAKAKYCSRKCAGLARSTHGHTRHGVTPAYRAWVNMHTRCENPKSTQYEWYGARGVSVCDRWKQFENFLADVGERPSPQHSLDRFPDQNGNYEPGNIRWATQSQQCRNRRNTRAVVRSDGERYPSMADAADAVGGDHKGVWAVCNGDQKTHRGFSWRYA